MAKLVSAAALPCYALLCLASLLTRQPGNTICMAFCFAQCCVDMFMYCCDLPVHVQVHVRWTRILCAGREYRIPLLTYCCAALFPPPPPRRYLDFMEGHLAETCKYTLQPELRDELATAIQHLEVGVQFSAAVRHLMYFDCLIVLQALWLCS
jgi:hypothetical protein